MVLGNCKWRLMYLGWHVRPWIAAEWFCGLPMIDKGVWHYLNPHRGTLFCMETVCLHYCPILHALRHVQFPHMAWLELRRPAESHFQPRSLRRLERLRCHGWESLKARRETSSVRPSSQLKCSGSTSLVLRRRLRSSPGPRGKHVQ